MTEEEIEKALCELIESNHCLGDEEGTDCSGCPLEGVHSCNYAVVHFMRTLKENSATQLKELLSALYRRTDNEGKSFTIYQKDVVELANYYGMEVEE